MRYTTKEIGDRGEDYAAAYLKQHQCIILDRNYRKRWGEIDIIARQKDTYLFVEVKTRHDIKKVLNNKKVKAYVEINGELPEGVESTGFVLRKKLL